MSDASDLLRRARALADRHGVSLSYVSRLLLGDHRRLGAVEAGRSFLRPPTCAAALKRLAVLERRAGPEMSLAAALKEHHHGPQAGT